MSTDAIISSQVGTRLLFENDRARGVRVGVADQEIELKAKVVVDASGRGALIGRQLKLIVTCPQLWYQSLS